MKTSSDCVHLCDLPDSLLENVARYLSLPSRALFAASLTAPSASWERVNWRLQPSTTSKAIVSSLREDGGDRISLDFDDIEKSLAKKLIDADIGALLTCINAKDTLRILKLAGCVNITGSGLEPLQGSTILELIDLSMVVKHEKAGIEPEPLISQAIVVAILGSIVDVDGCSLRYIQFPLAWCHTGFLEFRERYNQSCRNRMPHCSKCFSSMEDYNDWLMQYQHNVCYCCLKPFCETCEDDEGDEFLDFCRSCKKDYCSDCCVLPQCETCNDRTCKRCGDKCSACDSFLCQDCFYTCDYCSKITCQEEDCNPGYRKCEGRGCKKQHCKYCYDGKEYDIIGCVECGKVFCFDCRTVYCEDYEHGCRGCSAMIMDVKNRSDEKLSRYR